MRERWVVVKVRRYDAVRCRALVECRDEQDSVLYRQWVDGPFVHGRDEGREAVEVGPGRWGPRDPVERNDPPPTHKMTDEHLRSCIAMTLADIGRTSSSVRLDRLVQHLDTLLQEEATRAVGSRGQPLKSFESILDESPRPSLESEPVRVEIGSPPPPTREDFMETVDSMVGDDGPAPDGSTLDGGERKAVPVVGKVPPRPGSGWFGAAPEPTHDDVGEMSKRLVVECLERGWLQRGESVKVGVRDLVRDALASAKRAGGREADDRAQRAVRFMKLCECGGVQPIKKRVAPLTDDRPAPGRDAIQEHELVDDDGRTDR